MSLKIDSDVNRFRDIVRRKVRANLGKYISSNDLIGQQGGKPVKIPLNTIDLPRFTYGRVGGTGQGDGELGDPMSGQGQQPGQGEGQAGNEKGEHEFGIEFSADEMADILAEELQLPDIQDKGKGKLGSSKSKYNDIHRSGAEGLRHFRRTYKEALKRSITSGGYDPINPVIIPIKDDKRYKAASPVFVPSVNAVIIYILDVSGSMTEEIRHIVKSEVYWIDLWLNKQYNGLVSRFIIHDAEASEVDRQTFFATQEAGGTRISSGYKFASHLMQTEYPFSDWNVYVMHFSDGDNYDDNDNQVSLSIVENDFMPNCNLFCYEQVTSPNGSGLFYKVLNSNLPGGSNALWHKTDTTSDILGALKFFLGKGK